ncbi:MAG TPA: ATP-binding protein [Thermoanaerobaculia bacterium]
MKNPTPPASGERRAAGGLRAQYKVASFLTYEALLNGILESVRVADPEAGRVDDFQLLTPGRLDAYSVKWESHPEPFTLNKLISPSEDKPSLIAQLADGWSRLRARDSNRHIVVHLVTNAYPSTRGEGPLAHFLDECWYPLTTKAESEALVPDRWQPVWEKIRAASGLSPDEFRVFSFHCRLDFKFALPMSADPSLTPYIWDRQTRFQDINDLETVFFRLVTDSRRLVEIPRSQLIDELGWQGRLELRHPHEFPDPIFPYQRIEPTVQCLEKALKELSGGYILLLGTPGSGKSTLLTQTLRYRPERIVRYYAFVPQAQNANRGESENFLHDITLMLEERGIRAGQSLPAFDRMLLAERLDAQLRLLHEEWVKTGRKTILLIDGLDHIPREQHPTRSLLADLPAPERVPDGVYILLGSQTDQLRDLPSNIVDQVQRLERRLTMDTLGREAVRNIVSQAGLDPVPTPEEKERIYQLSGGHPLALVYLLNRLRRTLGVEISKVIAEVEAFSGRIDEQYTAHWRQIQPDRELIKLLAMLARIRGAIELSWVEKWASPNALYRLHNEFGHYFRQESHSRWHFFHNSFRIFLRENTARLPGVSSSTGDQLLYLRLADAAALAGPPWSWDEIFYCSKAGEEERALKLATLSAFREQFFTGRPWPEIREDLELLLPLTARRSDVATLARLLFIGMEIDQRDFNLNEYAEYPIPSLLARLGEIMFALDWFQDGLQGRLERKDGLRFAATLAKLGMREEAGRVFDLSEPLETLGGGEAIPSHKRDEGELLKIWVQIAPIFRDVQRLLEVIGQVRCEEDRVNDLSSEEASLALQSHLHFELLRTLQKLGRWSDHAMVMSLWSPDTEEDWDLWFWGHVNAAREALEAGQKEMAASFLEALVAQASIRDLTMEERIALAECHFRTLDQRQEASRLLAGVTLSPLSEMESTNISYNKIIIRLRLYRLRALFGERRSLSEVIPNARNERDQGLTLFERALVIVARLEVASWTRRLLPGSEFRLEAEKVLRLIFRQPDQEWLSWYQVEEHRGSICRLLIGAAQNHGAEALEALQLVFEQEWNRSEAGRVWPWDLVRDSAVRLADAGSPEEWVVFWCEKAESHVCREENVPERIKQLAAQVRAWLHLKDKERAREAFQKLLHVSLGIHQKEIQTNSWIAWAQHANSEDPANAPKRLQLLSSCLPDLDGKEVLRYAVSDLLETAWRWKPQAAQMLFHWMFQQCLVGFSAGLRTLVQEGLKSGRQATQVAILIFEELLLPFMRTAEEELAQEVTKSLIEISSGDRDVARLIDRILIAALGSTRKAWISFIQQTAEKSGIPFDRIIQHVENQEALGKVLRPISNEEIMPRSSPETDWLREEAELRERFQSLQDVEAYLATRSPGTYIRWENALVDIVNRLEQEDVVRLAGLLREQRHSVRSLNQMARRLLSLGELQKAWKVGELALSAAGPTGWIWRLAERVRVETFSILRQINKRRASELAFQMLIDDLRAGTVGFSLFGIDFHEIAPVLGDSIPFQKIWDDLEPYLEALFPNRNVPGLPDFDASIGEPPAASVLGALAIDLINHPVADIGQGAQRIIVSLLQGGEATIVAPIASALSAPDLPRQRLLVCLEAVAEKSPEAIRPLLAELRGLALSLHFGERAAAYRLLDSLGERPPPVLESRELPAVYDLVFPEREEPHTLRPVEAHEPLPPTEDPVAISMIIRSELEAISDLTGIQVTALYNRISQIVRNPSKPDFYEEEKNLRKQLESAGLRIPFRRPRTDSVREALFLIVTELADAGRLNLESLEIIDNLLRYADPTMLRLRPYARPLYIPSILPDQEDIYRRSHEDWTTHVSLATSALRSAPSASDWTILAEQTCLSWLDWPRPTEKRYGVIVSSGLIPRPGDDFFRSFCPQWQDLAREYEHLAFHRQHLIVRRAAFQFETPSPYFLAFNPSVARSLGWTFAGEDGFRWQDPERHTMVESLWWQDGCPHLNPPETSDEVGEGWLVRASSAGWEAIRTLYPDLKVRLRVERTARDQETRFEEQ